MEKEKIARAINIIDLLEKYLTERGAVWPQPSFPKKLMVRELPTVEACKEVKKVLWDLLEGH